MITDFEHYSGYGTANKLSGPSGPEVEYEENNIIKKGKVTLQKDEISPSMLTTDMPKNYLHIVPGTLGSDLCAGLFKSENCKKKADVRSGFDTQFVKEELP